MASESRHLAVAINRPFGEVYEYVSNPANLPAWAPGLLKTIDQVDGKWIAQTEGGPVELAFAPPNDHGVADHDVTLPSGESVHNPMRVLPDGPAESELVFTVRRRPGMTDTEYDADAAAVQADLDAVKAILEA